MHKKILAVTLVFAFIMSTLSAIPITQVSAQPPDPDTFINISIGLGETVDPAWAYDTASATLIYNVYEPLLTFDGDKVDEFVPMLATEWKLYQPPNGPSDPGPDSPPGTAETWYFKLREDVEWQDPTRGYVTTSDVEYSFERGMVMDHDGGPQWMILEPLLGIMTTREYNIGLPGAPGPDAPLVGHMIDDAVQSNSTHVWFNLKTPYAPFIQILSQSWGCILDKEWTIDPALDTGVLDNFPGFDPTYTLWVDYNDPPVPGPLMDELGTPERMMGTGPYMLDYIDFLVETYRVVRFDDYWGGWSAHPHVSAAIEQTGTWAVRKAKFLAGEVDTATVPRANGPELYGALGIRFLDNLEGLVGQGLYFNIAVEPTSPYVPKLGVNNKPDLFRDRNMRLALMYAVDQAALIEQVFMGLAFPIGNPIIKGIRYYNGTKPYVTRNLAKVQAYLNAAWGGQVYEQGFTTYATYNTGNVLREAVALQLDYIFDVSGLINFGPNAIHDVIPTSIPWATYIPDLYANRLASFGLGWLADYPDPHNWMQPFMHTHGDFSGHQNIEYGLDPATMNWESNTYGPLPYTNYAGAAVAAYDNVYVDGLIETGITLPDGTGPKGGGSREELYEELMDIFFAEAFTLMLPQATGRHWERDWLNGWFNNPIRPGYYYYDLWKGTPEVTMDSEAGLLQQLGQPVTTMWKELRPIFNRRWHLTSWTDNGDGRLSASDQIDMTNERGRVRWFHVKRVTITIFLHRKDRPISAAFDYLGEHDPLILRNPETTLWHEIYPSYSRKYHLSSWLDNGDGVLGPSDQIDMTDMRGRVTWWHVERVSTDIILTPKTSVWDVESTIHISPYYSRTPPYVPPAPPIFPVYGLPPQGSGYYLYFDAHSYSDNPIQFVFENVTVDVDQWANPVVTFLNGATGIIMFNGVVVPFVPAGTAGRITVFAWAWLRYSVPTDLVRIWVSCPNHVTYVEETISFFGPRPYPAYWDGLQWVVVKSAGKGWINTETMTELPDDEPTDNHVEQGLPRAGDYNGDGLVDYRDAFGFRGAYVGLYIAIFDFNGDGRVDYRDASGFRTFYLT